MISTDKAPPQVEALDSLLGVQPLAIDGVAGRGGSGGGGNGFGWVAVTLRSEQVRGRMLFLELIISEKGFNLLVDVEEKTDEIN